jgi:hypothetical protein
MESAESLFGDVLKPFSTASTRLCIEANLRKDYNHGD